MGEQTQRRTDRVHLKLKVEVAGTDIQGREFVEEANTVVISGHGALLVLNRQLAADQTLILRRQGSGDARQEGQARVVASIDGAPGSRAYCVAFLDPNLSLWGVNFPPKEQAVDSLGRILLECSLCRKRHVGYLTELELRSYESSRSIARHCQSCGAPTIWVQASNEDSAQPISKPLASKSPPESPAPAAGSEMARRRKRFKTIVNGCVRQAGSDEVVVCESLSPGGLCFRSRKRYAEGARIEIAVPFAKATANIFVPARILYIQELQAVGLYRSGVAYLPS